jgi:hypothetical protein
MGANVTETKSHGWAQMIDNGVADGWVHVWTLKLDCGHEQKYTSRPMVCRNQDVVPPAWVICKQCEKEGR